jgi:hypothetical protein
VSGLYFEQSPHSHIGRLTKRELVRHLTVPHLQEDGWKSVARDFKGLSGWRYEELDREHREFHREFGL